MPTYFSPAQKEWRRRLPERRFNTVHFSQNRVYKFHLDCKLSKRDIKMILLDSQHKTATVEQIQKQHTNSIKERYYNASLSKKQKTGQAVETTCPVLAPPIFPGRRQPSIVGRNELNYRVRNGNGWTLVLISTNLLAAKSVRKRNFGLAPYVNWVRPRQQTYYMTLLFNCQVLFLLKSLVTRTGFEPMLTA